MKKINLGLVLISLFALLFSCSAPPKEQTEDTSKTEDTAPKTAACTYAFNPDSLSVQWTAYKTSDKIGVGGIFEKVNVTGTKSGSSLSEVFEGASFEIPIANINSKNPDRDGKIQNLFFGAMAETLSLTGSVKSLADNKGVLTLKMNGIEKDLSVNYAFTEGKIKFGTVLNMADWDGLGAIKALNDACYDLHKGKDGVSKLWPEVMVVIEAVLEQDCK